MIPDFKPYFDIPILGKLKLEFVFYQLGYDPILFVCTDDNHDRFLCSCCKLCEEWIIGKVSNRMLLLMMDRQKTLRDVFLESDACYFVEIQIDGYKLRTPIPDDAYPKNGAYLRLPTDRFSWYRELIETECV